MIVKVCGLREAANIEQIAQAGADWLGMIFWPKSSRYVAMRPSGVGILPDSADSADSGRCNADSGNNADSCGRAPAKYVGVFVDQMVQDVITRVHGFGLDLVQLHGNESPTYLRNLRATIDPDIRPGLKIIKALHIATAADLDAAGQYAGAADYLLLDTKSSGYGGAGRKFDWRLLATRPLPLPFLLSGGIGPDDAQEIASLHIPNMIGVDINSRFETQPGMKDVEKVREFIDKIKAISDQ